MSTQSSPPRPGGTAAPAGGRRVLPLRPRRDRPPPDPEAHMALVGHLRELRDRLIRVVIVLIATTTLAFFFVDRLVHFFLNLLPEGPNIHVQVLQPAETFTAYFKVALTFGIVFAMPLIVYQAFRFAAPGLTPVERRWLLAGLPLVTAFFLAGVAFCYFLVLPNALGFLLNFGDPSIERNIRLNDFLGFVTNFLLAVGITFELPAIMFLLAKLGIVRADRMRRVRRFVVVAVVVIAAIITPTPDPVNQMIVAIPMYLLYELGIVFARLA